MSGRDEVLRELAAMDEEHDRMVRELEAQRRPLATPETLYGILFGGQAGSNPLQRRIYVGIVEAGVHGLTRSEIRTVVGSNNVRKPIIDAALFALAAAGLIVMDKLPSCGGRKPERWRHVLFANPSTPAMLNR